MQSFLERVGEAEHGAGASGWSIAIVVIRK